MTIRQITITAGLALLGATTVHASPLKSAATINGAIIFCTANNGILTCSVKSASSGTIGGFSMKDPSLGPGLCDNVQNEKKRLAVTSRMADLCTEPFEEGQVFAVTVYNVDGTFRNTTSCIRHLGSSITIEPSPTNRVAGCLAE